MMLDAITGFENLVGHMNTVLLHKFWRKKQRDYSLENLETFKTCLKTVQLDEVYNLTYSGVTQLFLRDRNVVSESCLN